MENPLFPHEMIEIHSGVSRCMNICIIYIYIYINYIYIYLSVCVCVVLLEITREYDGFNRANIWIYIPSVHGLSSWESKSSHGGFSNKKCRCKTNHFMGLFCGNIFHLKFAKNGRLPNVRPCHRYGEQPLYVG